MLPGPLLPQRTSKAGGCAHEVAMQPVRRPPRPGKEGGSEDSGKGRVDTRVIPGIKTASRALYRFPSPFKRPAGPVGLKRAPAVVSEIPERTRKNLEFGLWVPEKCPQPGSSRPKKLRLRARLLFYAGQFAGFFFRFFQLGRPPYRACDFVFFYFPFDGPYRSRRGTVVLNSRKIFIFPFGARE